MRQKLSEKRIYSSQRAGPTQSAAGRQPTTMNAKIVILLGLVAMAAADSDEFRGYRAPRASSEESYESSEAKYNFQWAVDHDPSSNEFGHQEARDGDNTQGSYYVQLPDGRLQQVTYYVDGDSGYIADVKYTGSASYESDESNESFRYYGSNESK
ncbi:cuticle protein 7-like [Scylla paramamosain]|uniref:cuticle protein 7-like n=1 Tax=Scylla paramamosain TaxID=85552 RepID=UPI0030830EB3